MRRSQLIPKICAAVVLLIAAVIISAPVLTVELNRAFGGGVVKFGEAKAAEFLDNRPVDGALCFIIGCQSDESSDDFKNGTYYYLVPLDGKYFDKEDEADVILVKTPSGSKTYDKLNALLRDKKVENMFSISGVIKKTNSDEMEIAQQIAKAKKYKSANCIEYCIDCSKPVSSYTTRFLFSLVLYAGVVASVVLALQTVKRNRDIDDMELRRDMLRASNQRKENEAKENGADGLFGDADRSYVTENTQYQGSGQSPTEVAQSLQHQAAMQNNNYQNNSFQNNNHSFSDDDGFFGERKSSDDKYDGFFGS